MSADNGVYILKTKDQFRVIHAQAIENIYTNDKRLNPIRVILLWGNTRYTKDEEKANNIAKMLNSRLYTEYGINTITFNKTWKHIVCDAKNLASKLLENTNASQRIDKADLEYVLNNF